MQTRGDRCGGLSQTSTSTICGLCRLCARTSVRPAASDPCAAHRLGAARHQSHQGGVQKDPVVPHAASRHARHQSQTPEDGQHSKVTDGQHSKVTDGRHSGNGRPTLSGNGRPTLSGNGRPTLSGNGRPTLSGNGRPRRVYGTARATERRGKVTINPY